MKIEVSYYINHIQYKFQNLSELKVKYANNNRENNYGEIQIEIKEKFNSHINKICCIDVIFGNIRNYSAYNDLGNKEYIQFY